MQITIPASLMKYRIFDRHNTKQRNFENKSTELNNSIRNHSTLYFDLSLTDHRNEILMKFLRL